MKTKLTVMSHEYNRKITVSVEKIWSGDVKISLGNFLRGIYFNSKTGNLVLEVYSRWAGDFGTNYILVEKENPDIEVLLENIKNSSSELEEILDGIVKTLVN